MGQPRRDPVRRLDPPGPDLRDRGRPVRREPVHLDLPDPGRQASRVLLVLRPPVRPVRQALLDPPDRVRPVRWDLARQVLLDRVRLVHRDLIRSGLPDLVRPVLLGLVLLGPSLGRLVHRDLVRSVLPNQGRLVLQVRLRDLAQERVRPLGCRTKIRAIATLARAGPAHR